MWGIVLVHNYVLSNSLNVQLSGSEINRNRCYLRWAISALLVCGVKYVQSLSTPQDLVTKWSTSSWSNSISGHSSSSGYSAWTLYSLEYSSLCFALLLLALVLSPSPRVTSHLFFSFNSDNLRWLHDFCASCVFSFLQGEERVLRDCRWFIRHLSSVVKSAGLNESSYPQVPVRFRPKTRQLRFTWIWANRPSSKGFKLLFPIIKANQIKSTWFSTM